MKKQYLVCIDSCQTALIKGETYLCASFGRYYKVWDEGNNYIGIYNKNRFTKPQNKDILDTGISQLQEKLQKYESLKSQLKELKTEINSIYSRVGEQLKLEL